VDVSEEVILIEKLLGTQQVGPSLAREGGAGEVHWRVEIETGLMGMMFVGRSMLRGRAKCRAIGARGRRVPHSDRFVSVTKESAPVPTRANESVEGGVLIRRPAKQIGA
jgi:hypothetical protein